VVQTRAFFNKIFKQDPSDKTRKQYQDRVDAINALEPRMAALTDDQLRAKTKEFQKRVQGGESLEAILPEAFAVSAATAAAAGDTSRWKSVCQ
jgi:preprotein translocase subunit SecA